MSAGSLAPGLPRVNTLARVEIRGAAAPLPSRVEDLDGSQVTIAAPDWPGRDPVGTVVTLSWACDLGLLAVSAVVARVVTQPVQMWVLRTEGRPRVVQARAHERVALTLPVTIDVVDRWPAVRFVAETLDLARGGLRLHTEEWVLLEHGDEIRLRLGHDEPPAIAAGSVVHPNRVRNILEFAVALRQPVPERVALLIRRLERQASEERPALTGSRWRR